MRQKNLSDIIYILLSIFSTTFYFTHGISKFRIRWEQMRTLLEHTPILAARNLDGMGCEANFKVSSQSMLVGPIRTRLTVNLNIHSRSREA